MQTARIGQAMSSPQRLRALHLLAQRPHTVTDLAERIGESKASTSAHLKVLRAACLVADEKRGREVWCRLASDDVGGLLLSVRTVAEHLLPELRDLVRQAEEEPDVLTGVSLRQLERDVKAGRVHLLDLRHASEFEAGHLPGAESTPLASLGATELERLRGLSGSGRRGGIVAYCRGPWCLTAKDGVAQLNKAGIPAKRLPAGVVEWRAQGLALETAQPGLPALECAAE